MLTYKFKLCFLSSFLLFLFGFSSFIYLYHIFLSLRVWDPKLASPKLGDQPQLWLVLPPCMNTSKFNNWVYV